MCDHVVVLHRGRVAFRGTVGDLEAAAVPGARGDTPLERGYVSVLAGAAHESRKSEVG